MHKPNIDAPLRAICTTRTTSCTTPAQKYRTQQHGRGHAAPPQRAPSFPLPAWLLFRARFLLYSVSFCLVSLVPVVSQPPLVVVSRSDPLPLQALPFRGCPHGSVRRRCQIFEGKREMRNVIWACAVRTGTLRCRAQHTARAHAIGWTGTTTRPSHRAKPRASPCPRTRQVARGRFFFLAACVPPFSLLAPPCRHLPLCRPARSCSCTA